MVGLAIFMVVFAINSAVHSYLILAYSEDELVSIDFKGNPNSSIIDAPYTVKLEGAGLA